MKKNLLVDSQNELQMFGLFPMGVGVVYNKDIPEEEHSYLMNDLETYRHEIYPFDTSVNTEVLSTDINIPKIKSFITESLNEYSKIMTQSHTKLKFTQAWLVKHSGNTNQYLYEHRHPNSIISGVYYINAKEKKHTGLTFNKDLSHGQAFIQNHHDDDLVDPSNMYAAHTVTIPAVTGVLLLFPSWANHTVPMSPPADEMRCSIAFNTWFDGEIGDKKMFTHLGALK
jgi:hypothetical protein